MFASQSSSSFANVSSGAPIKKPEPLVSGCKQVEAFGNEDDYEEEKETFVTLDLSGVDQALVPSSSTYRLIGVDTVSPYLQLSGTIMRGHVQTLLGTEMLFKETEGAPTSGSSGTVAVDAVKKSYGPVRFEALAHKRIAFRELDIKPKEAPAAEADDTVTVEIQDASASTIGGKGKNKASSRMTAEEASRRLLYPDNVRSSANASFPASLSAESIERSRLEARAGDENPMTMTIDPAPETTVMIEGVSSPREPTAPNTKETDDDTSWLDPTLT